MPTRRRAAECGYASLSPPYNAPQALGETHPVNYEFPTFTNVTGQRHQGVSEATPPSFAGVIATDSPHPQAEVWFGLLKTNPEENLSIR